MSTTNKKKQTKTIILVVIAFAALAWQIHGLFGSSSSSDDNTVKSSTVAKAEPKPNQTAVNQPQQPVATNINSGLIQQTANKQSHYTKLLNQLEVAKMERQVLDQQLAITKTRHEIATLKDKMQTLPKTTTTSTTEFSSSNVDDYQLAYIDEQEGSWSATISNSGTYSTVKVGSRLPNGSVVSDINKSGVYITTRTNASELLSFNGLESVAAPAVKSVAVKAIATPPKLVEKKPVVQMIAAKQDLSKTTPTKAQASNAPVVSSFSAKATQAALPTTAKQQNKKMLSLPHKNYTVQLMQADSMNELTAFAKQHKIATQQLHFYTLVNKGHLTYTMTYGNFSNEKLGLQALKALPQTAQGQSVKLESLKAIQNTILDQTV